MRDQDGGDGVDRGVLFAWFQILEERGFEVCLVNARHIKNVPGRRTDVCDCQWLQFLRSVSLLKASYRPAQEVCAIGSLLRHRESLVQMAATHVNHMQKALDQMNVQLHHNPVQGSNEQWEITHCADAAAVVSY